MYVCVCVLRRIDIGVHEDERSTKDGRIRRARRRGTRASDGAQGPAREPLHTVARASQRRPRMKGGKRRQMMARWARAGDMSGRRVREDITQRCLQRNARPCARPTLSTSDSPLRYITLHSTHPAATAVSVGSSLINAHRILSARW